MLFNELKKTADTDEFLDSATTSQNSSLKGSFSNDHENISSLDDCFPSIHRCVSRHLGAHCWENQPVQNLGMFRIDLFGILFQQVRQHNQLMQEFLRKSPFGQSS
jgi:hypothetical protein